jgi:tetratricopeptide (TPR) repeat protein
LKNSGKVAIFVALVTILAAMAYRFMSTRIQQERENAFVFEMGKALSAHAARHEAESEQILQNLLPNTEKWWPTGPHLVETLSWLGTIQRVEHKYDQAKPMLHRAITSSEEQKDPSTTAAGRAKMNLGVIARDELDDVAAERLFSEAAEALGKHPVEACGDDDSALLNLGYLADKAGHYEEAISYTTRAVAGYEKMFPKNPGLDVANAHKNLADLYTYVDNFSAAAEQYQAALNIFEQIEGPQGRDVAITLAGLALMQHGEAPRTNHILSTRSSTAADNVSDTDGAALESLANLAEERKEYAGAESLFQRACQAYEKSGGPNDLRLATELENLGNFYRDQPQFDITKAELPLKRSLAIREKVLGPEHPETARALSDLSLLYFYEKNAAAAEEYALQALPLEEKAFGSESLRVSTTLNRLGISERDLGKFKDAETNLKRALAIRERKHAPDDWIVMSLENLASAYEVQGLDSQAQPLIVRAQSIRSHLIQ